MAVNNARSMNTDLLFGQLDGREKSITPDRGGQVDSSAAHKRATELQAQYAIADHQHSYAEDCGCASCVY